MPDIRIANLRIVTRGEHLATGEAELREVRQLRLSGAREADEQD